MQLSVRPFIDVIQEWKPHINALLSDVDLNKATLFRHEADRYRFIAARILCYDVLKEDYAIPLPMNFEYSELGKPALDGIPDFNWSHSGEYVAFFCAEGAGVDIELIKDCNPNAFESVFTHTQLNWIKSDKEKFHILWTIKESVMKSTGLGFQLNPLELNPIFTNATNEFWKLHFGGKVFLGRTILIKTNINDESYAISYCTTDPTFKLNRRVLR